MSIICQFLDGLRATELSADKMSSGQRRHPAGEWLARGSVAAILHPASHSLRAIFVSSKGLWLKTSLLVS
jgi:hypothetical protein